MREKWTAVDVVDRIRDRHFQSPAHVLLEEVRSHTGAGRERYADALVASVWPSRGLWLAGIEVKISRADWRKELKSPEKAEAISKFCDYWWVAAPRGIVPPETLPATWGLIEVHGARGCDVVVDAPKLTPIPLTTAFAASIMRNIDKAAQNATERALAKLRTEQQAVISGALTAEARVRGAEYRAQMAERATEYAQRDVDKMRSLMTAYAEATGIQPEELLRTVRLDACPSAAETYRFVRHMQRSGLVALQQVAERATAAAAEVAALLEKDYES